MHHPFFSFSSSTLLCRISPSVLSFEEVPGGYRRSWRYGTSWPFEESLGDTVGRSGLSDRRSNKSRFTLQCPTNENGKLLIALVRFMSDYFTFTTLTVGTAYCYA
ncbi:hypothetical protein I308_102154 [Cryptococcus tetragattii IND107]|uniref:Secreted protein n=1 Tax=Cryptococcus tetragattii IND107 TaxID=1296105 RepID=A0ABR3BWL0_9TREE